MLHLLAAAALLTSHSGVHGRVVIDPARPVCTQGQSCSAPDAFDVLSFVRRGRVVRTTRTDLRGAYGVGLPAGTYAVRTVRSRSIGRGLTPRTVRVPRGRYVRVNFVLDVGIR